MFRCGTLPIVALMGSLLFCLPAGLQAQSNAELALDKARTAYQAEQFAEAREQAQLASQTDAKNPDVWLLLGKAQFQLGQLDDALQSWKRLLVIAPEHQYARRMVNSLQGELTDADLQIKLARSMIDDGFVDSAREVILKLQRQNSLSAAQREQLLMLSAEVAIGAGQGTQALASLKELTTRNPNAAGTLPVRLLTARARLATGGASTASGLAELRTLAEEAAEGTVGQVAALELLLYDLRGGEEVVPQVASWIEEHAELPAARRARVALRESVERYLANSPVPIDSDPDAPLSADTQSALAAAEHAFRAFVELDDQKALANLLIAHLEQHYASHHAYDAARSGLDQLDQLDLPAKVDELIAAARQRIDQAEATQEYRQITKQVDARTSSPDVLAQWIADHADHPHELEARQKLVFAYLSVTRWQAVAGADAPLSAADQKALAAASTLIAKLDEPKRISEIVHGMQEHFQSHYFQRGAHGAGIAGVTELVALEVPAKRHLLLHELLTMQKDAAIADLQSAVAAGTVPSGTAPMPATLQAAADTAKRINTEYPATPAWQVQAQLANSVMDIAGAVAWPSEISTPKAAHGWAIELAMPVVAANQNQQAVTLARNVIERVINDIAAVAQTTDALASSAYAESLGQLPPDHFLWDNVTLRHVDLLMADAVKQFEANVRSGKADKNAKLTETQQQILTMLSKVVQQRPALAPQALEKLNNHLQKWLDARHDSAVENAYETFAANLPPAVASQAHLTLARLWFGQVQREHRLMMANGFEAPRELDPRAEKALKQCYELASQLGETDPLQAGVRAVRQEIINHYLQLEYYNVAQAAIEVSAEPLDADLEEQAELELAGLKRRIAERQLAGQLQQHLGREQLVLSPAFNEAIAALKKFITDHPTSQRVSTAASDLLSIAQRFEQVEAWDIAAGIYADLEVFAAEIDSLTQARPGESTFPEKAAVARASALHTKASRALAESRASQPSDAPPPAAMSQEFQAANAAWEKVIADYGQRPVAQVAIGRIMSIAQEYAAIGAWDVADATYAGLLALELPLRAPERLEFGRAICQLGKVMPDHARQILAALAVTGQGESRSGESGGGRPGVEMLGALGMTELDGFAENLSGTQAEREARAPGFDNKPAVPLAATASEEAPNGELANLGPAAGGEPVPFGDRPTPTTPGGGGFGSGGPVNGAETFRTRSDAQLFAAMQHQLSRQAQQVARLRDETIQFRQPQQAAANEGGQQVQQMAIQQRAAPVAVLSDAELARQQKVLDEVYAALQAIRQKYPDSPTATQARSEIFVMVNHWREIAQWNRAAQLARQFLSDNPTDAALPSIRQAIARDLLAWASQGLDQQDLDREELLTEVATRFETAREELRAIIAAFPDQTSVRQQAQWDIATSFLTQARVVTASSPTLARGQFVRAATELLRVADLYHDHPRIGSIPDMLWGISQELASRSYHDEAISVWNKLRIHYPTHNLADQAALQIAHTWQRLGQPLRAVEAFLELNFARGGNDQSLQNEIYQIAVNLKSEQRWIESLHVLETFVDSFPTHAQAGQALTMIGQIHQENEAWTDAIAAYGRVIDEFPGGSWTTEARWSIAECTINLSHWQEAIGAYADFKQSYPEDSRAAEADRRIEVLKQLDRYQDVVDEEGQPKAFDAQYQMAKIIHTQLANPVKAIIEYRKVAKNWPGSHLSDDALYEIGKIYLNRGEKESARTALLETAEKYPGSPLADDALYLVGQSYLTQADQLAAVDRSKSQAIAKDIAQRQAYQFSQDNRKRQMSRAGNEVAELRKQGKADEAELNEAYFAGQALQFEAANTLNLSNWAAQQEEVLSAAQLADRQDKINAALRKAVAHFRKAASVSAADKADDALLQMAQIYDERLKDSEAAMNTWEEIVRQYSGTAVAEDASWKIANYYEQQEQHQKAIAAYQTFFRNYRRSPRAGEAQAAIAENYEQLGQWVQAMDAYTNYLNNFPEGPLVAKARDQISWIKTYRL